LPVGIQTFREIVEGGYVYADKTGYIADLARDGKFYFLSRPRRFGKSLFVDTVREAFLGHRELFEGLALAGTDFDFTPRPVIRLDMSSISLADTPELLVGLTEILQDVADSYGIELAAASPAGMFRRLISALHRHSGHRVVVLIDEYDKPIVEHLTRPELADANRMELRYFYGVLKAMDAHVKFVMLTGVSKFARMSLFSQLNNLLDITLDERYVNICGITEPEFDALFGEHLQALCARRAHKGLESGRELVRASVFDWYDGFSWDGASRVFNPFSLLSLFARQEFYPYWYSSGTPQMLMKQLRDKPVIYGEVQGTTVTESFLDSHEIEDAPLSSLLFQTGFLTVAAVQPGWERTFTLGFPNMEVSTSFSRQFLAALAPQAATAFEGWFAATYRALDEGRPEYLEEMLTGLFAVLPWNLHVSAGEALYHAVFLVAMQFAGLRVAGEVAVAGGEIDGTIDMPGGRSYVVEFKHVAGGAGDAPVDVPSAAGASVAPSGTPASEPVLDAGLDRAVRAAWAQIDAKGYADRYRGTGRRVYKVGIAVAGRGVVRVRATPPVL
jgi:hypothetical protein